MATKTSKRFIDQNSCSIRLGDVKNYNNYYNFDFYSAKVLIALRRFICTENKNYKKKLSNLQVLNNKYEIRAIKVYLKNKITKKQI